MMQAAAGGDARNDDIAGIKVTAYGNARDLREASAPIKLVMVDVAGAQFFGIPVALPAASITLAYSHFS